MREQRAHACMHDNNVSMHACVGVAHACVELVWSFCCTHSISAWATGAYCPGKRFDVTMHTSCTSRARSWCKHDQRACTLSEPCCSHGFLLPACAGKLTWLPIHLSGKALDTWGRPESAWTHNRTGQTPSTTALTLLLKLYATVRHYTRA